MEHYVASRGHIGNPLLGLDRSPSCPRCAKMVCTPSQETKWFSAPIGQFTRTKWRCRAEAPACRAHRTDSLATTSLPSPPPPRAQASWLNLFAHLSALIEAVQQQQHAPRRHRLS